MGATNFDGPAFIYGNMGGLAAGYGDATPDPNQDAGPSGTFQGDFLLDVRYPFFKDKVQGYTGVVPGVMNEPFLQTVDAIPAAAGVATLAAAALLVGGTPMTLVSAQAAGITPNVPIRPNASPFGLNSGAVTNVLALDFGFAFGNLTSGNVSVPVADSTQFTAGMPVVVMQSATSALLTTVQSIVDATHITLSNAPTASNATAPIGTGNLWGPSPVGFPAPDAHLPYVAAGPGLLYDVRQTLMRNVSFTGVTGGTGGNIIVTGYDSYWQLQHEQVALPVGATTTFGKKTWKAIVSAVPVAAGLDTTHNYSMGTGDVFGFAYRTMSVEYLAMFWNGTFNAVATGTASGWLAADTTNPATNTTGDVRGTWQVSANGGGTAWNAANAGVSNGTISSLAMSGKRLAMWQTLRLYDQISAFPATPQTLFGQTPA